MEDRMFDGYGALAYISLKDYERKPQMRRVVSAKDTNGIEWDIIYDRSRVRWYFSEKSKKIKQ